MILDQSRALGRLHAANLPHLLLAFGPWACSRGSEAPSWPRSRTRSSSARLQRFEPIAAGTINSNFALDTERGRYFVRVNEGKAEADVAWEARLVAALAERWRGDAAAARRARWPAVRAAARRTRQVGQRVPVARGPPPRADRGHARARRPARRRARAAPPRRARAARRRGGAAASTTTITSSRRFARFAHERRSGARAGDRGARRGARSSRPPPRRSAAARPHGIIHGDLFRDNVLWEGGRDRRDPRLRAGVGRQPRLRPRGLHQRLVLDRRPAARARARRCSPATSAVRPLPAADREALPIEVRAAAARFTITRITDVYLARVTNPEKDFRAFLARCEAWRGPALGQLSVGVVASPRWLGSCTDFGSRPHENGCI